MSLWERAWYGHVAAPPLVAIRGHILFPTNRYRGRKRKRHPKRWHCALCCRVWSSSYGVAPRVFEFCGRSEAR